ncbi:hypothetical protein CRD86_22290 [Escherichia coli]|nr:hypothetical protein CRD86_22290 [Escherichia coli]
MSPSVDVFSPHPHHLLSFGSRGFDVLRGPAFCSSGGRPQKFLPAFGQKVLRDVHFTPGLAETVVAVFAPGDRGLNR